MASLFRVRRRRSPEDDEDGGDGRSDSGRVSRRRISLEEEAPLPAAAGASPTGSSSGWLSGVISGAKRVISSVLFSSPEEEGSEEEDDEDDGLSSNEIDDINGTRGAMVSYSESKLAIEQLLMKETFSRDECDRMIKLIQSRITESPCPEVCENGTPKEITSRVTGGAHDYTGTWRSLNRNKNFPESVPFSSIGPGGFAPGSPLQVSPELCNAAVIEAKKWLEEKRQGSGSKPESHGPCTLNTDMLNSGLESDLGSPVDLAKTYMRSLPPWQSPYLGSQKCRTPPSVGVHIDEDEWKSNYSMSSSKVTKQDYLSTFWDNLEESRRAHLGSSGSALGISKFRQYGSTSKLFENGTSVVSSGAHEKGGEPVENSQGSDEAAAHPTKESSLPNVDPSDPTTIFTQPLSGNKKNGPDVPTKYVNDQDNGNNPIHECRAASEVNLEDAAQRNVISTASITKDVANQSGMNVQAATTEPEVHGESHPNLVSGAQGYSLLM